jgi:hypothetical protein
VPALTLPYAHLNLRFNPFREATREERAALAVVDIDDLVPWLAAPRRVVQFVAPHGHGKSTHLIALHARFPGAPFIKIHEGERAGIPEVPLVFIDEIELMPRRRDLWRRSGSFAFGSHRDLGAELRGLVVRTVVLGEPRLRELVDRRIEWARRGPGPVPRVSDRTLATLTARHGGDVRAIEAELYDVVQRMREAGDAEV